MTDVVLIVAAHPDDEVLGCGGTILRHVREGRDVHVAILGEGITSRYEKRNQAERSALDALRKCSHKVAKRLKVKGLYLHELPDNRFDTIPLLDIVKTIEKIINQLSPKILYTHHAGDLNIDHSITSRAVITASRPLPGCSIKELYSFEAPSSTEWSFKRDAPAFNPNVFVDITETLETKIAAMNLYGSEIREFPHPRSSDALTATARRWGSIAGVHAAEAFELIRKIS